MEDSLYGYQNEKETKHKTSILVSEDESYVAELMDIDDLLESRCSITSSSTDTDTIRTNLEEAVNTLNKIVPTNLASWIQQNPKRANFHQFTENNFPEIVKNVSDSQCRNVPPNLQPNFVKRFQSEVGHQWVPHLPTVMELVSTYEAKLCARLDIRLYLQPDDFQKFTDELLTKALVNVTDSLTIQTITSACTKVKDAYGKRNKWVIDKKKKIGIRLYEVILPEFEQVIPSSISSQTKQERLLHHAAYKAQGLKLLKELFIGPDAVPSAMAYHKIELSGRMNAIYNVLVRETIVNPKKQAIKEDIQELKYNQSKNSLQECPKNVNGDTGERPKGKFKRNCELFYNVRDKDDDEKPTRLGPTQIYYYTNKPLSTGRYATVLRGYFEDNITKTTIRAAIKRLEGKDIQSAKNEMTILVEICKETNKDSVNIVKFLACEEWKTGTCSELYLAMELADMNLGRKIVELKDKMSELTLAPPKDKLVGYIHDACKGLQWLHTKNIIHRDIKPQNILLFSYPLNGKTMEIAKLADFGISRIAVDPVGGAETKPDGTDEWAAPEVLQAKKDGESFKNKKSQDIYSLGLTAHYTLSLGEHPFGSRKEPGFVKAGNILHGIVEPSRLPKSECTANDFIQKLIQRNLAERPVIPEVLKHPLFWDVQTSFNFLVEFTMKYYEKRDPAVRQFRKRVEEIYVEWRKKEMSEVERFNWRNQISPEIFEGLMKRRMNKGNKSYDRKSLMPLMDLIRDKYVHCGDMAEELLADEYFGEGGSFCKDKYGKYFLKTFPDILIFVANFVHDHLDEYAELKELSRTFFETM